MKRLTDEQIDILRRYAYGSRHLLRSPHLTEPYKRNVRDARRLTERALGVSMSFERPIPPLDHFRRALADKVYDDTRAALITQGMSLWRVALRHGFAEVRRILGRRLDEAMPDWLAVVGPAAEAVSLVLQSVPRAAAAAGRVVGAGVGAALSELLRVGWPVLLIGAALLVAPALRRKER